MLMSRVTKQELMACLNKEEDYFDNIERYRMIELVFARLVEQKGELNVRPKELFDLFDHDFTTIYKIVKTLDENVYTNWRKKSISDRKVIKDYISRDL